MFISRFLARTSAATMATVFRTSSDRRNGVRCTLTCPDSIFDKSRMSLMIGQQSVPGSPDGIGIFSLLRIKPGSEQ